MWEHLDLNLKFQNSETISMSGQSGKRIDTSWRKVLLQT